MSDASISYSQKTPENQRFPGVFGWCNTGTLIWARGKEGAG